jgi:hypothetical protein
MTNEPTDPDDRITNHDDRRADEELRKFIDSLGTASFGIITALGYQELKEKFDAHTRHTYKLAKMVMIGMLVQLLVIGYVFYTDYVGRDVALTAARQGCERDKLDRNGEAAGWRIAEKARLKDKEPKIAEQYDELADGLEARGKINCDKLYPKASLIP